MEGGYYSVVNIVNPGVGRGGPLQILRRDCGDHVELAIMGVSFYESGATGVSVMHQAPSRVDKEGRIEQLSLTWLSPVLGAIPLAPLILKYPKITSPYSIRVRDQVKNEAWQRFRASLKEAFAKYRILYYNCNEVEKVEAELVNLMLSMNLGA